MKIQSFRSHAATQRRCRRGFTLIELLIVLAAISSVAAMGFMSLSSTQRAAETAKLRQDVAALNTAVRTYLLSGGDLSTATTANAVIARLKTTTHATSRSRIPGLRGSMVDLRLRGVSSSDPSVTKAAWDPNKQAFVMQQTGTGFSGFVLDPAAVPTTLTEETRTPTMAMNSADKWIWAFNEQRAHAAGPRTGATAIDTPVVALNDAPSMTVLQAPDFSKPGALYNYSAFKPGLKVSLVDRNAPNSAETYYSIANGPWIRWTGTPLSIPRSFATEVRAYSAPLDPDRYEQSAVNSAVYETIFFEGDSSGLFKSPLGDSGLVSNLPGGATNPHFTWGTPAIPMGFPNPNALTFAGKTFAEIAPDEVFELGTLTYYNGSTYAGTNATSVQLTVKLNLTTPGMVEELPFTFRLLSTTNKGKNADKDADYVYIPDVSTKFNTTIKGKIFYLVLSFGSSSSNGFTTIDEFHTHENKTMTGTIYGMFTTADRAKGVAVAD